VDVRERDVSVTGELRLGVAQSVSKLVYFLPVFRYASQPLDAYVRFVTFTRRLFRDARCGLRYKIMTDCLRSLPWCFDSRV